MVFASAKGFQELAQVVILQFFLEDIRTERNESVWGTR